MQRREILRFCAGSAAAGMLVWASLPTPAGAVDFSGKRIEIIVPASEGGGTDVWVRFWQPYMQKYLPGNPTVVVRNMPGGGQTIGAHWFMDNMKTDGTNAIATTGSTQFPYLLGDPRVRYEYKEWKAVLATPVGGATYASPELGLKSAADVKTLQGKTLQYGSQGPTSLDLLPVYAYELLGIDIKPIFGMKGRADGRLAFERGELKIDYQTTPGFLRNVTPLVEAGKAVPLFSWGMLDENGGMIRDPAFPDLPHYLAVYEQVHGKPLSGIDLDVYMAFFTAGFAAQKLLNFDKDTPPEILDAWTDALRKAQADPEFQAKKTVALGPYSQAIGANAEKMKVIATTLAPEARDHVQKWLKDRFDVTLKK
ncbi:MAG: hypothetical protein WD270_06180 [Acetobacterales bacterium]